MKATFHNSTYATANEAYHAFIDKSKRKPYLCGICGRDITDPYHQPRLYGKDTPVLTFADPDEAADAFENAEPPVEIDDRQMGLFTFEEMRGY